MGAHQLVGTTGTFRSPIGVAISRTTGNAVEIFDEPELFEKNSSKVEKFEC